MLARPLTILTALAAMLAPMGAAAQNAGAASASPATPQLTVELNKMEDTGDICRAYFIVRNDAGAGLDALELDTFLFGTDDIILQRLALPFGAVADGRMRIVSFEFAMTCEAIGKLFVNDIIACETGGTLDCAAALSTSSRAAAPLDS
ncbi:MAG: hypothetical protein AAFW98_11900 [Pseudomonadota bacterium]